MNTDKNIFKLRKVEEESLEDVLKIYQNNKEYFKLSHKKMPSIGLLKKDITNLAPNSKEINKFYRLIEYKKQNLGVISYTLKYPMPDTVYIDLLLIDSNLHNKGYGQKFFNEFRTTIEDLNFKKFQLGVLKQNIKGYNFWLKLGFRPSKEIKSTIHKDMDWTVVIMIKNINKNGNED